MTTLVAATVFDLARIEFFGALLALGRVYRQIERYIVLSTAQLLEIFSGVLFSAIDDCGR